MRFKRTFHVFVDNFSTTYKLLLYKVIVWAIFGAISFGVLYPVIHKITDTAAWESLTENIGELVRAMFNFTSEGPNATEVWDTVKTSFNDVWEVVKDMSGQVIASLVGFGIVVLVQRFVQSLGHFAASSVVHDKMEMQAKTPFLAAYTRNLGKAALFSVIYVPITFVYDIGCLILLGYVFVEVSSFLLLRIFMFILLFVILMIIRQTFTTDWIPCILFGGWKPARAIKPTFSRKGKGTWSVLSGYVVYMLILIAGNVAALFLTFGVGLLITLPASYVILFSFQNVNYCYTNDLSYFLDRDTIVRPEKERVVSREDFFRGNDKD
ncbi:MAG: hypothetical protein LUD47_03780 [Clostridia bacterium]|nr:hypothetical protein [Clostridia bacterium]